MTAYAYTRGHKIEWDEAAEVWRYADTGEPVSESPGGIWEGMAGDRPCAYCHQMPTSEGHDACLGELPGVKYACCGHGVENEGSAFQGYIFYEKWPLWMTNKNRWPLVIAIVGSAPLLLLTVWIALPGTDWSFGAYGAAWGKTYLLALAANGFARWVNHKQAETTNLLRRARHNAFVTSVTSDVMSQIDEVQV